MTYISYQSDSTPSDVHNDYARHCVVTTSEMTTQPLTTDMTSQSRTTDHQPEHTTATPATTLMTEPRTTLVDLTTALIDPTETVTPETRRTEIGVHLETTTIQSSRSTTDGLSNMITLAASEHLSESTSRSAMHATSDDSQMSLEPASLVPVYGFHDITLFSISADTALTLPGVREFTTEADVIKCQPLPTWLDLHFNETAVNLGSTVTYSCNEHHEFESGGSSSAKISQYEHVY